MNLLLKFGPWIALAAMTALYLGKRDDLASAIEQCNTDKMASIAEAERLTRETIERVNAERIAQLQAIAMSETQARQVAEGIAENAIAGTAEVEQRNRELQLEVFNAELIPDSAECLNVFVPARMLHAEDCGETSDSGGSGANTVCEGASGINETDPFAEDFANITYGDMSILWGRDRDSLQICNGQLFAIESLSTTN